LIAQAQSGTGKTAAFTIGVLEQIEITQRRPQAIILAPTRELAQQINEVVQEIGIRLEIKSVACIGGSSIRENISRLREGVHVVVGTPGRIYDMILRKELQAAKIKVMVLDEAD